MSKKRYNKKILSIIGNFKLSEAIQLKELTSLYMKQEEEIEQLQNQLQQKENTIKDIKSQLDYLETYSSKEDVFEDMKRRLDRIDKIIGSE